MLSVVPELKPKRVEYGNGEIEGESVDGSALPLVLKP